MTPTVTVRIRHADYGSAIPFCTWDPNNLDGLMSLINRWGLYVAEDGLVSDDGLEFSGQFVLAESETYFEILVHAPDNDTK